MSLVTTNTVTPTMQTATSFVHHTVKKRTKPNVYKDATTTRKIVVKTVTSTSITGVSKATASRMMEKLDVLKYKNGFFRGGSYHDLVAAIIAIPFVIN